MYEAPSPFQETRLGKKSKSPFQETWLGKSTAALSCINYPKQLVKNTAYQNITFRDSLLTIASSKQFI
jgi:hypothetical protein